MSAPSKRLISEGPDLLRYERGRLEHENSLIDHRLNWLVTSQSFLAAAYGLTFQAEVPWGMKILMPAIALATGALIYVGLLAAISVFTKIEEAWLDEYPACRSDLVAGDERTKAWGLLAARFVPPLFMGGWAAAFAYEIYQLRHSF